MNSPFGGTPQCPTCGKSVYAAERAMGPGRKYYHKPCLKCLSCSKRLDSLQLVEHEGEPYCKNCHLRNFSTKDLRHSNLPQAPNPESPPISPPRLQRTAIPPSPRAFDLSSYRSLKEDLTYNPQTNVSNKDGEVRRADELESSLQTVSEPPVDIPDSFQGDEGVGELLPPRPQRSKPPVAQKPPSISIYSRRPVSPVYTPKDLEERSKAHDVPSLGNEAGTTLGSTDSQTPAGFQKRIVPMSTGGHGRYTPTQVLPQSTGRGFTSPTKVTADLTGTLASPSKVSTNHTGGVFVSPNKLLAPSFTGTPTKVVTTKYGYSYSPGQDRVECPKCGKVVYHAEQVNAIGKKWHKNCLRCTQCGTSLDSTRLTEKDGDPYCKACYSKLYGPQGAGYALLGKAGA